MTIRLEEVLAKLPPEVEKQVKEGSPLGMTDSVWDQRLEWVADAHLSVSSAIQGALPDLLRANVDALQVDNARDLERALGRLKLA